ncbi:hypothetical protein K3727_14705 [Rhodobacteraceae bacterium M382]|nr:hypothetical protein K3727_14705 [Rhodobacteraceae bacterium M382]
MIQAHEITDRKSFEAWLNQRPEATRQQEAVILASRLAMRVLPMWWAGLTSDQARKGDLTALPIFRCNFISGVAGIASTPEMSRATFSTFASDSASAATAASTTSASAAASAESAISATFAASAIFARSAASATFIAASAARSAAAAADGLGSATADPAAIWAVLQSDAAEISLGSVLQRRALWPENPPPELIDLWERSQKWLTQNPGHDFWIRWYQAALDGRPLTGDWDSHWKMLHDIALIRPDDWDKGAEHIAALIAEIENRFSGSKRLTNNSDDGSNTPTALDKVTIPEIRSSLRTNRLVLPPTLEAISGHLLLEFERLQDLRGNNSLSEEIREELLALSQRLRAMMDAVATLKAQAEALPVEPSEEDAEKAKFSLAKLFQEMRTWPDGKEGELADVTCRLCLVGATTAVFCAFGATAFVGAGVGAMFFGSKHLEQGAKAVAAMKAVAGSSAESDES